MNGACISGFLQFHKNIKVKTKATKNTGNLIAHATKIANTDYAELTCVSLRPTTKIAKHYIDKYHMSLSERSLSIEIPERLYLIYQYDHD